MRFDKRQILKNVGSSWFALGINIAVGVFLSPYILHRLGDTAFGLWVLIFSATGYYGLFDLGIRSSIIRYVATYSATQSDDELNRLINTTFTVYTAIGLVAMLVTLVATYYVDSLFRIQPEFLATARWLFLMVGAAVSLGFPLGMFGGVLEGLQRFYLINWTSIGGTVVRALFIVLALRHGHGLLMVAFITVLIPLLTSVINAGAVLRVLRPRFGVQYLSLATLRRIATYSGTTFIIIVAHRLRFKTDALVIGAFVSAAGITYFTIGSRLVDYATDAVSSLAQIFIPMSSQSQAQRDVAALRKIVLVGNRACAFITLPITVILTILGKSVIEAWVGPKYISVSYPVLLVLLYPTTLMLLQSASTRTLWGLAKHGTWAWIVLAEGLANIVLSIVLVRPYGIMGDAIGTAIPLTCSMTFFLPGHLCRILGIKLKSYLYDAYALPLVLCLPLVAVLVLMQHWFVPHRLLPLLVQLAIGGIVYGAGLAWAFWTRRAWDVGQVGANKEDELMLSLVESYQEEA